MLEDYFQTVSLLSVFAKCAENYLKECPDYTLFSINFTAVKIVHIRKKVLLLMLTMLYNAIVIVLKKLK